MTFVLAVNPASFTFNGLAALRSNALVAALASSALFQLAAVDVRLPPAVGVAVSASAAACELQIAIA